MAGIPEQRSPNDTGQHRRADRLLVSTARRAPGWTALLIVTAGATSALALIRPAALAAALDAALTQQDVAAAVGEFTAVLGAIVLAGLAGQLAEAYVTTGATVWLRGRLVRHMLELGLLGQRRFQPGDLVSRLTSGTAQMTGITPLLTQGVARLATAIGGLVALLLIDVTLVLAMAVTVPLGLLLMRAFVRRTATATTRYLELQGELSTRMVDALDGVRTIRAAGTLEREVRRVLVPAASLADAGRTVWRGYGQASGQAALLGPLTGLVTLALAGYGVAAGRLTAGQLLAVTAYTSMALGLLDQTSLLLRLAQMRSAARRAAEVLATTSAPRGRRDLPPGPGALALEGVTFRAGNDVVLDRLDLRVPAGSTVAIVGRSGAGKTTLAAVAGGLLPPDEGRVLLDGVPLHELDRPTLRRAVAYGFERPALMGSSIADLIGFGLDSPPPADIQRAARAAAADAFIRRLPHGYDTPPADAPLSGGEAQRLGLARALARGGRLLILDDAMSSLDTVTESQVAKALTVAAAGRTRLMVAHRASTAARADLVAWLDGGRIRLLAPHDQLSADPGYRAIFESSTNGDRVEAPR